MNIGEAARASGVSAKMIRYYEETGLIPAAARTDSGYRAYTPADVHRLQFVRRARDLGFAVTEIAELLGLWGDRTRQSADVKRVARAHIVELRQRIAHLQQMADTLQDLIDCCAGDRRPDCPILADLEKGPDGGRGRDGEGLAHSERRRQGQIQGRDRGRGKGDGEGDGVGRPDDGRSSGSPRRRGGPKPVAMLPDQGRRKPPRTA